MANRKDTPSSEDEPGWELIAVHEDVSYYHRTATSGAQSSTINDDHKDVMDDQISEYRKEFEKDSSAKVAQNAVCKFAVTDIALRRDLVQTMGNFSFSVNLDRSMMPATNQKDSGRCWMFGTLNLFRFEAKKKMNLDNFEFSESYLYFWDILEKSNHFMECIIETSDQPVDDRIVSMFLDDPVEDGGDWGIAVNLIQKYGLVPKSAYPESYTSSNTDNMLSVLVDVLRSSAQKIRCILDIGGSRNEARKHKESRLADIWRILCIHLGSPPERFDWQWRDKDGTFHHQGVMTPLDFSKEFLDVQWENYVSLIQDPRHEYYRTYSVEFSTTVRGGKDVVFLNIPSEDMKLIGQKMLEDGMAVWFACNVDTEFECERGLWDAELYDLQNLYGVKSYSMTKADRLHFGETMGTHVMLFTGVDVKADGNARRWRVENSWGTEGGDDGYSTMNDNWFDENVFELIAPLSYLSDSMVAGLKTEPIMLPGWDAMGSRCRKRVT